MEMTAPVPSKAGLLREAGGGARGMLSVYGLNQGGPRAQEFFVKTIVLTK